MRRIPALDGLRAVSILIVTLAHLRKLVVSPAIYAFLMTLSPAGVDVFFVISGYLITTLLLRELEGTGAISIVGFYRRRLLRITPAYLFFLATAAAMAALGFARVDPRAWPYLLSYTYNLVPGLGQDTVGHVWSLCVEEHFYLIWPAALIFLGRRGAGLVLAGVIAVAATLRFVLPWAAPAIDPEFFSPTRLDTIAIGCLLAFVEPKLGPDRARGWPWALLGALIFFGSIFGLSRFGKYELGPKAMVEALSIALVIHALVQRPADPVTRLLEHPALRLIGRMSYSLYLAQPAFFGLELLAPPLWTRPFLLVGYATLSYTLIEKPFLRMKDRHPRS